MTPSQDRPPGKLPQKGEVNTNNTEEPTDLESLLEMELDSIYVEPEAAIDYDLYISLETLALQSPHGGVGGSGPTSWQDDNDGEACSNNDEDPGFDAVQSSILVVEDAPAVPRAPNDRRRPSLRKELFQHHIKSHDIASPGPKGDDHYAQSMKPEYDLASPLLLPSSPVGATDPFAIDAASSEDNNATDAVSDLSKLKPVLSSRVSRVRKVKHGGIYTLLLKGMKRPDDDLTPESEPRRPSLANSYETLEAPEVFKRGSPVKPVHVRHGGIYRMLRDAS
ncbi:hypothetical protein ACHHYP_07370 [Achlya hypogyna]|uniref:Uncharacterized protein n=1 Tax=Achlya hypogyna TaxID=1202772 RepID=A0A1V9ZM77_ACHHY|nr:hypothetical protein ACHHYP_07370 [Achlya hypogyna]